MPSHSYNLFGKDSLEIIPVSYGTRYREHWKLAEHPGPRVHWNLMGGESRRLLYLYPQHLQLLYQRFSEHNSTGISIEINDVYEKKYKPDGVDEDELEALYEQRKIFVNLIYTDEDIGYPHLRRYLPEIFEPPMVAAIGADPWLDRNLLGAVVARGEIAGLNEDQLTQHPRWSPDWRSYCDRLLHNV